MIEHFLFIPPRQHSIPHHAYDRVRGGGAFSFGDCEHAFCVGREREHLKRKRQRSRNDYFL